MHRVVLFLGGINHVSAIVVPKLLSWIRGRDDLELAAICLPRRSSFFKEKRRYLKRSIRYNLSRFIVRDNPGQNCWPSPINLDAIQREFGAQILVPPEGNPNAPEFVELLRTQVRPTLGFCFYYIRKFQPALLESFETIVNYHNGLLPAYRGLRATAWSLYNREPESGFTFHHMDRNFDEGPILLSGAVPINPGENTLALDCRKAELAAAMIGSLLDKVLAGESGVPQGDGTYYSEEKYRQVIDVGDPSVFSLEELELRLRAFGKISVTLDDCRYQVCGLRREVQRKRFFQRPSFRDVKGREVSLRNYTPLSDINR